MSDLGAALGDGATNDSAKQLFVWGILYGLLSAVFAPITTEITEEVWQAAVQAGVHQSLPAGELATMVVRGWIDQASAQVAASRGGIEAADFTNMVNNRRNPISPEEAAVALRRKIIPQDAAAADPSFNNAIQQGDLGDQWGPIIQQLATQIPSPADVLQAVLEGQITDAQGRALYTAVGGVEQDDNNNINWYDVMFNTRGQAPTPNEAGIMARRGAIVWGDGTEGNPLDQGPLSTSFHQAFLEGPWRNKWEPAFKAITDYLPPPRTVTAMLKQGALSVATATDLLTKQGLTPDLVAAYVNAATATKVAATKKLSESNVLSLLNDKLIDEPTAVTMLEQLGYPANEATVLASTSTAALAISDLKASVNRIGTFYIGHKIDRANALTMLANLGVDAASAASKVDAWDVERAANVRVLTPAQIADAWEYQILDEAEAMTELGILGFTPLDAWTVLSIKAKQPLPNKPAGGPGLVT